MTRLFHVSDLHFGRADQDALDWFAATVAGERPDAVICTGDLTMRARSAEFEAAARYLEALPVPVTVEPGNHDLPYFNPLERMFRPYRRFGRVEKMVEKPLELPSVTIVPLRTTARAQLRRNWSWGVVSESSLRRAVEMIAASDKGHVKIVAAHHPLVDRPELQSRAKTKGGLAALKALAEAGAHAVLSGHVHDPFDVDHTLCGSAIRMIGAGTLSERLRATRPSFNEIRVMDGTLSVMVRTIG
ncbi:metallophosphoesterase [Allosphingosinicella flava]|uniref:Metallophosphoesterase n=1 Tax=Allosphingosinicella flava TaxID=2771430 RepID=A0A7T2LMF7_9SPHN|nr:metallophosphoesterase [Sphingosinicella flava]QPQ55027.1 metallophosphoesterase [Sphingosinicella flava]